jgi:cobalt-zinc-cadmium efflux system outer membrane protein
MRTRTWCAAATLACLPTLVAAQTVLSEADALAKLSADSPRVREIRSGVDVTRAEALAAGRWPNPRFTFNRESVAGVTENMLMLTQPLPIAGRRGFEVRSASALVAASEQRADEAVRQVRAALRQAYADLVGAQLRATEMMASRDRLRGLAEVLGRREVAGDAAGYDRLRAEREVIEIEADLTAAGADRARAQAALAAFFAPTTDPATLVAAVPQAVVPRQALPTVEELMAHAESQLPELMALKHEQESASLAISAAGRRPIPEPEVVAGTKSSNVAGGDLGTVFSVHIAVPLFDRAKPEQALAQARRAQAEARIAAFQAVLHADLAALRTVVLQRRGAADSYRASTATSAAQLERIAQVSYDAGERSILELVDAYRNSGLTRLRQVALDAAVRNAEIELELVSGWEIR